MNRFKKNMLVCLLSVTGISFASNAHAISLEEGKKKGLVGETSSGYLDTVEDSPEASKLTGEINSKRKQAYKQIAEKHGSPLEVVEKIGGKEAIENSPSGTLVKAPSGEWLKK